MTVKAVTHEALSCNSFTFVLVNLTGNFFRFFSVSTFKLNIIMLLKRIPNVSQLNIGIYKQATTFTQ